MLTTPVFGLGGLHRVVSQRQRMRILETAYDAGFRVFDVAPSYGEGLAENQIGRFIAESAREVTILTKFGIPFKAIGELPSPLFYSIRAFGTAVGRSFGADFRVRDFAVSELRRSVTSSLRRLRVDVIDCLFIHEPLSELPSDDLALVWDELKRVQQEGLIRSFGLTLGAPHSDVMKWVGITPESAAVMLPVSDSLLATSNAVTSRHPTLAFDFVTYLRSQTGKTPSVEDVVRFARTSLPCVRPVVATRSVTRIKEYGHAFS